MASREFQDSVRKFISVHPDCIYGLGSGSQSKSVNFWNGLRTEKRLLDPVRNSKLLFTCENFYFFKNVGNTTVQIPVRGI